MSKDSHVPFACTPKTLPVIAIRKKRLNGKCRKMPKSGQKGLKSHVFETKMLAVSPILVRSERFLQKNKSQSKVFQKL